MRILSSAAQQAVSRQRRRFDLAALSGDLAVGSGGERVSVPRWPARTCGRGASAGTTLRMMAPRVRAILRKPGSTAAPGKRLSPSCFAIVVGPPSTRACTACVNVSS
jgi:hypothetical protein